MPIDPKVSSHSPALSPLDSSQIAPPAGLDRSVEQPVLSSNQIPCVAASGVTAACSLLLDEPVAVRREVSAWLQETRALSPAHVRSIVRAILVERDTDVALNLVKVLGSHLDEWGRDTRRLIVVGVTPLLAAESPLVRINAALLLSRIPEEALGVTASLYVALRREKSSHALQIIRGVLDQIDPGAVMSYTEYLEYQEAEAECDFLRGAIDDYLMNIQLCERPFVRLEGARALAGYVEYTAPEKRPATLANILFMLRTLDGEGGSPLRTHVISSARRLEPDAEIASLLFERVIEDQKAGLAESGEAILARGILRRSEDPGALPRAAEEIAALWTSAKDSTELRTLVHLAVEILQFGSAEADRIVLDNLQNLAHRERGIHRSLVLDELASMTHSRGVLYSEPNFSSVAVEGALTLLYASLFGEGTSPSESRASESRMAALGSLKKIAPLAGSKGEETFVRVLEILRRDRDEEVAAEATRVWWNVKVGPHKRPK